MALDTVAHDIYRGTSGITLPTEISQEIFQKAIGESAVMKLAERVYLPGRGLSIPVVTGDPIAQVVAESTEKPVSNSTFQTKTMTPYKFAVIELFSNEFRRDLSALYDALIRRLPGAIAKAYDDQVFNQSSMSGFDTLKNVQAITYTDDIAESLGDGIKAIAADGYRANGLAASPYAEALLVTATDTLGRPLFMADAAEGYVGRVFGAPVVDAQAVAGIVAGDWSQAKFGIVEDIKVEFSDQATVNDGSKQVNLWQRNMFAVRCEAELGFVCADTDAFFKIAASGATGTTA